jgi:hypothetical protein
MMNIVWPWANPTSASSTTNTLSHFFNGNRGQCPRPTSHTPEATNNAPAYENLEEIELQDIDPDLLMPRKIVVHRKYKQRSE